MYTRRETDAADRNRASAAFAHKLGETLECLGVTQ